MGTAPIDEPARRQASIASRRRLGLRVRIAHAGGQRAKPLAEQGRTRWPYAWTCGIGYVVMLAYIWTIAPIYW